MSESFGSRGELLTSRWGYWEASEEDMGGVKDEGGISKTGRADGRIKGETNGGEARGNCKFTNYNET